MKQKPIRCPYCGSTAILKDAPMCMEVNPKAEKFMYAVAIRNVILM